MLVTTLVLSYVRFDIAVCYSFDICNKQEIFVEIVAFFPLVRYHKEIAKAASMFKPHIRENYEDDHL